MAETRGLLRVQESRNYVWDANTLSWIAEQQPSTAAAIPASTQVSLSGPAGSAVTAVSASTSSQTALSSNAARLGAVFFSNVTTNGYLKLGATASTSSFTLIVPPQATYELPTPAYTGRVDVMWDGTPSGKLLVTELS